MSITKENFIDILGEYIYLKTDHYEYKQILKILTYGDIVFQETIFEEIKFVPFSLVLDEEKNYKNVKYVQNALNEENKYFEEQIEGLKDIAPVFGLFIGIGMLLNAVSAPYVTSVMQPLLKSIVPSSDSSYIGKSTIQQNL